MNYTPAQLALATMFLSALLFWVLILVAIVMTVRIQTRPAKKQTDLSLKSGNFVFEKPKNPESFVQVELLKELQQCRAAITVLARKLDQAQHNLPCTIGEIRSDS
jgi:hypothetical protein